MEQNRKPLIHLITNYVTVNDVVNVVLASGATAICADSPRESAQITSLADALVLNIGTPSDQRVEAMLRSGQAANEKGIPVLLDPVGLGASDYRMEIVQKLLSTIHFSCIRGNISEIAALYDHTSVVPGSAGVEASDSRISLQCAAELAARLDTILVITSDTDYVVSADRVATCTEGTPLLTKITGSGCMLDAYLGACFAGKGGTDPMDLFDSALQAVQAYGQAAVTAEQKALGTASFRMELIDEISRLSGTFTGGTGV